ncbi:Oxoprolinase [Phaffia rhodozyma]|uniref:Oxoprolinase n=1 Tax=Phaffia rhodozyma TaxID=264483 RepID=A0A0F7SQ79_PHARH|nr:Oxoprolinase [Phaffia rhodozyma]
MPSVSHLPSTQKPVNNQLVRIAIDRGGTFTDVCTTFLDGTQKIFKLLSVDPSNYADAPTEAIRRVLSDLSGEEIGRGDKLRLDNVESVRMGTTVATNALLERQGERCALLVTKGWKDILRIGQQTRPDIFDLSIQKLSHLYEMVVEIDERVTIETSDEVPSASPFSSSTSEKDLPEGFTRGLTGEVIKIIRRPQESEIRASLKNLKAQGFKSLAIALLHSYTFSEHEDLVAKISREMGFSISVSRELQPMIKVVSRANSATADAYLSPVTRRYIESFSEGFEGGLKAFGNKLLLMQSDGGLCTWDKFSGLRAILSGPAGGVIGFSKTCYDPEEGTPLVAVDMGGTSTDVARFAGQVEVVHETTTAEVIIQAPQLDINTIAAGGGSRLFFEKGMFVVGPESCGAHPGPACYKKGGPLAVTDANLVLGRLLPEHFPNIFGPNEDQPLDIEASKKLFRDITDKINQETSANEPMSIEDVALGFLKVANEAMARPIRILTEARGFDASGHNLVIFGGAGPQHGASIAASLNISRILVPRFSSVLSAYGMALADIITESSEPSSFSLSASSALSTIKSRVSRLRENATESLRSQGFNGPSILFETFLNCRFASSSTALMIQGDPETSNFEKLFIDTHRQLFGFVLEGREIVVDDVRIRATGSSTGGIECSLYKDWSFYKRKVPELDGWKKKKVFFEQKGWSDTPVIPLAELEFGSQVYGPALIWDATQTILTPPGYMATVLPKHVIIDATKEIQNDHQAELDLDLSTAKVDPIQLSVFSYKFMSIAERMGQTLRQTAISVNIKERLDFSCALFSPDGGLVGNAPNIPVHLGAVSHAVRYQIRHWGEDINPGDVFLSNHPSAGGSHLPDLTVMTPAFSESGEIVFWTASRAHHADIGGIRAGSMPPFSKEIWQEGAQITAFKLVSAGKFDEAGVIHHMYDLPGKYPGCSGTRTLANNISDLKAQVSANHRGAVLIRDLIKECGIKTVQFYMKAIQDNAEASVKDLLRFMSAKFAGKPLEAVDHMDDGSAIALKIDIDPVSGQAIFDFTGTSPQVYGNLNAPTAILYSAILYVLRSMLNSSIPLNQGCLLPITLVLPEGTILSPSIDAATVGGNVETSQRVVDVILKAFQACGASQGGCNNLTFGSEPGENQTGFGYYETIGGGAGAGPTWDGQSGIQCHMTNTRIGDPEIIEKRYPVIIHEFSIRAGSGGDGQRKGGDGVIRDIEFTAPVEVAILSERRSKAPYGMKGGLPGQTGSNFWMRKLPDGSFGKRHLGGKNEFMAAVGDRIIINSPGGGGYGLPDSSYEGDNSMYGSEEYKRKAAISRARANGSLANSKDTENTN